MLIRLYFQGHSYTLNCPKYGFHALSSELLDGFSPNLQRYIVGKRGIALFSEPKVFFAPNLQRYMYFVWRQKRVN